MSYTVTLWCGCSVSLGCDRSTDIAATRIVESRGATCPVIRHEAGARLWLWELLPSSPRGEGLDDGSEIRLRVKLDRRRG